MVAGSWRPSGGSISQATDGGISSRLTCDIKGKQADNTHIILSMKYLLINENKIIYRAKLVYFRRKS